MKRREFITALGGGRRGPWCARAAADDVTEPSGSWARLRVRAGQLGGRFWQRLRELELIEGRNVVIEYRWGDGSSERAAEIAAEFVRLKVNVIVTAGGAVLATKQATSVIQSSLRTGCRPGR